MDRKNFERRIESEAKSADRISNADITCRDCIFKFDDTVILGNTSRCEQYEQKPDRVVFYNEDCYKKEVEQ